MDDILVLVTGASGYIACHIIKRLLEEGYKVRGTVRSIKNAEKTEPLLKLAENPKHELQLVEADLNSSDGWDEAVEGCYCVMHTASPFPNIAEKEVNPDDIIIPATEGTIRVLTAASEAGVKKVILTSSFAAVFAESEPKPEHKYNEEDWTDPSNPTVDAYCKSKTLAERAAWDFVNSLPEDKKFELSVVNPTFVMGPPLIEAHKSSTSVSFITDILMRKNPAVVKFMLPFCDVRDVALAHLLAMTKPEAVSHRHIIASGCYWHKDIATIVANEFGPQGYKIATCTLPNFAVWLASFYMKPMKNLVPKLGRSYEIDNSRMVDVLGIVPTPIETSVKDMVYAIVDMGMAAKSVNYRKPQDTSDEQQQDTQENQSLKSSSEVVAVTDLEANENTDEPQSANW